MHTVYENDIFEHSYGTDAYIKHIPSLKDRGEAMHIMQLLNSKMVFYSKVMSKDACIEHGKTHSKVFDKETKTFKKDSPWAKEPDAMCKKTVLIQLTKLLPKSVELQKALAMDNTTKSVVKADMFEVPDETNWNEQVIEANNAVLPAAKEGG